MLNDASLLSKPWKSFTFTFFPDKCNGELGNGGWEQNISLQLKTSWTNQHQESEKYRKKEGDQRWCAANDRQADKTRVDEYEWAVLEHFLFVALELFLQDGGGGQCKPDQPLHHGWQQVFDRPGRPHPWPGCHQDVCGPGAQVHGRGNFFLQFS